MSNKETMRSLITILCDIGDEAMGKPKGHTLSMLLIEALSVGRYLPLRDFKMIGATPHVYDEKMEEFYKTTETYIPGLLRWHLSPERILLRLQIIEVISTLYETKDKQDIRVLCLGDGIGIDSLVLARHGYSVTYSDYDGLSSKFAELLFRQFKVEVTIVTGTQAIENSHYDFVVNCDVLEHVPAPKLLISEIERYLKQDGLALVTEAFGWLEPYAVSHLLSNVAYIGKLPRLFAAYNMHFVQKKLGSRLHVYTKAKGQELKRQRRLLGYSSVSAWKLSVREKMTVLKRRLKRQYPFNKRMYEEGNRFREAMLLYGTALELTFDQNTDPEKCLDLLLGHHTD